MNSTTIREFESAARAIAAKYPLHCECGHSLAFGWKTRRGSTYYIYGVCGECGHKYPSVAVPFDESKNDSYISALQVCSALTQVSEGARTLEEYLFRLHLHYAAEKFKVGPFWIWDVPFHFKNIIPRTPTQDLFNHLVIMSNGEYDHTESAEIYKTLAIEELARREMGGLSEHPRVLPEA